MSRWMVRAVTFAVLAALEQSVSAAQTDFGIGFGVGHSDNINYSSNDPVQSWVGMVATRLDTQEHTADVDARLRGTAEYRDYETNLYNSQLLFAFDSAAIWTLQPDRLTWKAEDYFRQATVDFLTAPTPSNRQNVNAFDTGPERVWRISRRSALVAGARYGNFYFEKSTADSQRVSGYGRWIYGVSPITQLSANVELSATDFYDKTYTDYDKSDAYLRLDHRWLRSRLEADAGGTSIRRQHLPDVNGFLGDLTWTIALNSYSGIEAYVEDEYTDAGHDVLRTASRGLSEDYVNELVTGDVFLLKLRELAYHWRGIRTSFEIFGGTRTEDYQSTPNDRKLENGGAELGYSLSPTLRAALHGAYERTEYLQNGQVNKDNIGGLRLDYRINTHVYTSADFTRTRRDSNLQGFSYEENRVMVNFWYQLGAPTALTDPFGADAGVLLQPRQPLLEQGMDAAR